MIKAIETRYKGYRFRSRTEARWAVFLDALGIEWDYEFEGFELPSGWYLPDFRLIHNGWWLEVKGDQPTDLERILCYELANELNAEVHLVWGTPPGDGQVNFWKGCPRLGLDSELMWAPSRRNHPLAARAARVARSARFEHGERPNFDE